MYSNSVKASLSKRSTLVDDTHSSLLHNTRYRRAGGSEGRTNTGRTGHPTSLPASPARGARSADYCILRGRPTTRRGGETAGDSGTRAWRWRQVDTLLTMNGHRGRVWGVRVGRGWFVVVVVVVVELSLVVTLLPPQALTVASKVVRSAQIRSRNGLTSAPIAIGGVGWSSLRPPFRFPDVSKIPKMRHLNEC